MAEMKGIKLCGECGNYDWKKHKCKIGCNDDSNAQASFYGDCPLPDVVPKSEVENLEKEIERLQKCNERQRSTIKAYHSGKIRVDVIKEFAERLRKHYSKSQYQPTKEHPIKHTQIEYLFVVIDQIAKEMIDKYEQPLERHI